MALDHYLARIYLKHWCDQDAGRPIRAYRKSNGGEFPCWPANVQAQDWGVKRIVLARELSPEKVRRIQAAASIELELFVHGALCVSYSGQCFSSEAWGGRSANRGQCAQACRLPYEMLVDGAG